MNTPSQSDKFILLQEGNLDCLLLKQARVAQDFPRQLLSQMMAVRGESLQGQRGQVFPVDVAGVGRCIARFYRRGGFFSSINESLYFSLSSDPWKRRPGLELNILTYLHDARVAVPEPVAAIAERGIFYHGLILTKEIPNSRSLLDIWRGDVTDNFIQLVPELATQVHAMLLAGVMHVDLHPGNVLLSSSGSIYLIDFDKAYRFPKDHRAGYANKIIQRWQRAVNKWGLQSRDKGEFAKQLLALLGRGA